MVHRGTGACTCTSMCTKARVRDAMDIFICTCNVMSVAKKGCNVL
jgi:hypothetical protein